MIELLLIITIIGLIAVTSLNIFKVKDREKVLAQSCASNLYHQIKNFLDIVKNGRGVLSGTEIVFPKEYKILFSPQFQEIFLGFTDNGHNIMSKKILLSGMENGNTSYCNSSNYTVKLSGTNIELTLQKDFFNTVRKTGFLISGTNNSITGQIIFQRCDKHTGNCYEIFLLQIDKRINGIRGAICENNQQDGKCFRRINH